MCRDPATRDLRQPRGPPMRVRRDRVGRLRRLTEVPVRRDWPIRLLRVPAGLVCRDLARQVLSQSRGSMVLVCREQAGRIRDWPLATMPVRRARPIRLLRGPAVPVRRDQARRIRGWPLTMTSVRRARPIRLLRGPAVPVRRDRVGRIPPLTRTPVRRDRAIWLLGRLCPVRARRLLRGSVILARRARWLRGCRQATAPGCRGWAPWLVRGPARLVCGDLARQLLDRLPGSVALECWRLRSCRQAMAPVCRDRAIPRPGPPRSPASQDPPPSQVRGSPPVPVREGRARRVRVPAVLVRGGRATAAPRGQPSDQAVAWA